MSVSIPPSKKGWMKKQGRKGLVKNWKKRYFVLEAGKLLYYVDKLDIPPFGDVLKVLFLLRHWRVSRVLTRFALSLSRASCL